MRKTNVQALEYALTIHFAAREGLITRLGALEAMLTMLCEGQKNLCRMDVIDAANDPRVTAVVKATDEDKQTAIDNVTRRMA